MLAERLGFLPVTAYRRNQLDGGRFREVRFGAPTQDRRRTEPAKPRDGDPRRMNVFFNGLGRFTVRFRWFIVVVWIIGTVASVHFLPSLGSQVNNNNSAFLPASAPSTVAGNLAEPLVGKASLVPVIIIGVSQHGPITAADTEALTRLGVAAKKVPNVEAVQYVGTSQDGHAVQLLVEASIAGYSPGPSADVINGLTAAFTKVGAPPGIQFHLAGAVATNVRAAEAVEHDRQQDPVAVDPVHHRAAAVRLPLAVGASDHLVAGSARPAVVGLAHRRAGLSRAQDLPDHTVALDRPILGAGTDYGLFLVFRVREGLRSGLTATDAVARAVARVGESMSASAGTVILALLTLLFASFGIYHDLGVPLAIGIAVMLVAGVTLLPALLSILGRAVFWPAKIVPGEANESWWGKVAQRVIARPAHTLAVGVIAFGALAFGSLLYSPAGFGEATAAPTGATRQPAMRH